MNLFYFSLIYLGLLILLFKLAPMIAKQCISKGYLLEEIKKIVWNVLNSFIINLTMVMMLIVFYYTDVISGVQFFSFGAIILGIFLLTVYYLFKKIK